MSEKSRKNFSLGEHPVIVISVAIATIVACCLPVFIFVTGKQSLPELLSSNNQPTSISRDATPFQAEKTQAITLQNTASPIEKNSETPLPSFPTTTPLPIPAVSDTDTAYPTSTATLESSATVPINTSPDSVLDFGQSWHQDELLLTLNEVNYNPNFPESECDISFGFYIESVGSNTINLSVKSSQFQATDNLGRSLQRAGFSQMSVCPAAHINEPFSGIIEPGKRFPSSGFDYWQTGYTINLTDTAIDYIIVTVNNLYHFNNAKWKVPINN